MSNILGLYPKCIFGKKSVKTTSNIEKIDIQKAEILT